MLPGGTYSKAAAVNRFLEGLLAQASARIVALGIVLGLAGTLAATRLMLALLYGVSPTDPWTFTAVALLLAAVSLLATWLPARRAAAVEPLEASRTE